MASHVRFGALAVLCCYVEAHQCSDGSRVQCMAVRSAEGAPSTYGQSYGASGYPLCTPEGNRVMCLVNHDYHMCSAGRVPCCVDGSNPAHGNNHGQGPADHDACVSEDSTSTTVQAMESGAVSMNAVMSSEPIQFILDNMDTTLARDMANAFEGSYQPCMKDAYNGQFHHDWSRNKGSAHFSMSFDPPKTGCYQLEEYHPGSDAMCQQYMPRNARLDIDYCKGLSKTIRINQAVHAAQWNEVDALMFYVGHEGRLTMKNSPDEQCQSSCFWIADAFRLTWIGPKCSENNGSSVSQSDTLQSQFHSQMETPQQEVQDLEQESEQEQTQEQSTGVLLLRASFASMDSVGSLLDLEIQLRNHASVIEATLEAHFGDADVKVTDISLVGRRLQTGSNDNAHVGAFEVAFVAHGAETPAADADLDQMLQSALVAANAGVLIESARVDWQGSAIAMKSSESSEYCPSCPKVTFLLMGVGVLAFLVAVCLCALLAFRYKKARSGGNKVVVGVATDKEGGEEKLPASTVADKAGGDLEGGMLKGTDKSQDPCDVASNTTGTTSEGAADENRSEEGCSSQDSNPTSPNEQDAHPTSPNEDEKA